MKKKLDNKIRKFATAEKEAPVSAPKASFLASGLLGILEQMNESPAGTPSRSETEKNDDAKEGEKADGNEGNDNQDEAEGKIVDPSVDHLEVSDMELDSESENGGDDTEPSAAPQLSDTNSSTSAVSTPKPVPTGSAVTTLSPSLNKASPSVQPKPQYGYTMTVNNSEGNETSSPASHNSAPSPDGSPDLNLEIYEGPPAANALPSDQLGVMTNQSFLGGVTNEQKPGAGSPGPNTMNLLAQLMNKQWRNDGSFVEGADSPGQGSNTSNTPVQDDSSRGPLLNFLGNLLSPLVHSQANQVLQQGEVNQSGDQVAEGGIQQEATNVESFDPAVATDQVESKLTDVAEAASKHDSGPSTDEEGAAGDNTPEHGLDFAQASPIILRSDTLFPHPPIPPNFSGPGQMFQNRPPMGSPPFVSPDRMPRFPNEPGMFMRDGPRRTSIEEQLMEEQHLRSPGMRSPRMQGPPMEWNRGPPFGPRGNVQPVRESRDPRLRRREMMGRSTEGPPFIDRVPPMEMRGRPPGIGHPADRDGAPTFMERQGHDIRREEMEREEIIRRRLSVGDERDGPISIEERERRIWVMGEGRPPMEMRPELHGERREGPFPFERHERGVEIRESFHPIERHIDGSLPLDRREGPHPLELRDGPPHMRGDMNHPIDRRHPIHPMDRPDLPRERREPLPFDPRGPSMDRPEPHHFEAREPPVDHPMDRPDWHPTESHPFDQRGPPIEQLDGAHSTRGPAFDGPHPVGHQNEFHRLEGAPEEVPTSEEELPGGKDRGDKSTVGVMPQEQNPGEVFPEGGDERPPVHIHEGPHQKLDKPDDLHNEMKFNQTEGPRQNEQLGGPMFRPGMRPQLRPSDERSMFDIRPEFHMDDRGPAFGPPERRDDNRPIRPIGGPFGPRHEGRGRFPGPRNFHPNFGPRHFRPRHEHEGGRPRFHPMRGGPRLKRPGPHFHPDPAKRPHY